MAGAFRTIASVSEGFYKEKGSKFLAFAYPVDRVDKVKAIVDDLKKRYHDARHHCFAYIIGPGPALQTRANDDGEPSHSAGDPILGQIRSCGLVNVLVVVVRYFGGTKLGVSGLVNAYRTATEEALRAANIIEEEIKSEFQLIYAYNQTSQVMRILSELHVVIVDQAFDSHCHLSGKIEQDKLQSLTDKLALLHLKVI